MLPRKHAEETFVQQDILYHMTLHLGGGGGEITPCNKIDKPLVVY